MKNKNWFLVKRDISEGYSVVIEVKPRFVIEKTDSSLGSIPASYLNLMLEPVDDSWVLLDYFHRVNKDYEDDLIYKNLKQAIIACKERNKQVNERYAISKLKNMKLDEDDEGIFVKSCRYTPLKNRMNLEG